MHKIELPTHCDRASAVALYPELSEAMGEDPTQIDASKVEKTGQAMLQLLVAATRTGGGIALVQPSDRFAEAVRMAGLEAVLGGGEAP